MLRRVATHPPSLLLQRISLGLLTPVVDEHQERLCGTDHEECDAGDAGDRFPPRSRCVVDQDGRPGTEQCDHRQSKELDVVPQLGIVKPGDDAQDAESDGIPCIFYEPSDPIHAGPTFLLSAPRLRY